MLPAVDWAGIVRRFYYRLTAFVWKDEIMARVKLTKNKNLLRPKKTGAARRRRVLEQRNRLLAAGIAEDTLRQLNDKQVRAKLKELKV